MADVPVREIVNALADVLRGITIANGYNTDLGAAVQTEATQTGIPTAPRTTVWCDGKSRAQEGQGRPGKGRSIEGWIEIVVPASYTNAMDTTYAADEDVDRCLSVLNLMPSALPVEYEETKFLDRPEGLPVVIAQIRWSTAYRRRSGS